MKYYIAKRLDTDFDQAVTRAREVLSNEGFGIITEVNMQEKIREKTGKEIPRYLILGACNPPLAYESIQKEERGGLFLPCNVIVRQTDDHVEVAAIEPVIAMQVTENKELEKVADKVRTMLEKAIRDL